MPESVHLCDFPKVGIAARDADLESQMDDVIATVSLGRQLRADRNLKVRQPLKGVHVVCRNKVRLDRIAALQDLIADELNVREVWFSAHESELALFSAKPSFSRLGPRLGPLVKKASGVIQKLNAQVLEELLDGKPLRIDVEGQSVELSPEDLVVERKPKEGLAVASKGDVVVALEIDLTQELIRDGLAREFVNKVQNMRKAADLEVTQRIKVTYVGDAEVREAVSEHQDYVRTETLATVCVSVEDRGVGMSDWDLNGHPCAIGLEKC